MSKVTVALGSFVVGALVMFLLGSHTSIFVQPASAERGIVVGGAEPVVPPLRGNVVSNSKFENVIQPLDGLDFRNCVFKNVIFEYSGGSYSLANAVISGAIRVNFKGAAANTMALHAFLESLNAGTKPKPLQPNAPLFREASNVQTMTVDFISPYGQK
ncbi:exported hypothetical protein [Syntrophobacter sp. SbD2]|nr:exported hypothetical protein [Syntrophobacter sp. SbD2]